VTTPERRESAAENQDHPPDHERTLRGVLTREVLEDVLPITVPTWDDDFWVARDAEVAAERAREAQERTSASLRARAASLRETAGFPARAVEGALEALETTALVAARKFVGSDRSVAVLAGGVGAGKTTASAWIALYGRSGSPAFLRAAELEARGRYDKDLRTWLRGKTLLVIDDLGAEMLDGRGNFQALLDEIIDSFYGDRKKIVITTNLIARSNDKKNPQFIERYGERIASRLYEVGTWADCGVTDLRRNPLKATTTTTTGKGPGT